MDTFSILRASNMQAVSRFHGSGIEGVQVSRYRFQKAWTILDTDTWAGGPSFPILRPYWGHRTLFSMWIYGWCNRSWLSHMSRSMYGMVCTGDIRDIAISIFLSDSKPIPHFLYRGIQNKRKRAKHQKIFSNSPYMQVWIINYLKTFIKTVYNRFILWSYSLWHACFVYLLILEMARMNHSAGNWADGTASNLCYMMT